MTRFRCSCMGKICLLLLLISGLADSARAEPFRMGFFKLSPHAFNNPQDLAQGTAVEYFRQIAEKMGIKRLSFSELPLPRLIEYLKTGGLDAGLTFGKNAEREKLFAYPETPFFNMRPAIAISRSHPLEKIKSADDLLSLAIASYAKGYRSPLMQDKRLDLRPITVHNIVDTAYKMIDKARIDAFYSPDAIELLHKLKESDYRSRIKILMLPESPVGLYTVFSKKSAEIYLDKYETVLAELGKNRPYDKVLEEFLGNPK